MTEEQLAAIEARRATAQQHDYRLFTARYLIDSDVPALVAEVRRLQALVAELDEDVEAEHAALERECAKNPDDLDLREKP